MTCTIRLLITGILAISAGSCRTLSNEHSELLPGDITDTYKPVASGIAGIDRPLDFQHENPDEVATAERKFSLFRADLAENQIVAGEGSNPMRIGIIGGGTSGLAAAHYLRERGYKNITVYEREPRVSGKVFSYEYGNRVYELGAVIGNSSYVNVKELATKYRVTMQQWGATQWIETAPNKGYNFLLSPLYYGRMLKMPGALMGLAKVFALFGDDVAKPGLAGIHPDLFLPTPEFARKYRIEVLIDIFAPYWIGCGYSYLTDVPAIYALKFLLPAASSGIQNTFKNLSIKAWFDDVFIIREGFSTLFERLAATLPDVRVGQEVTKVERVKKNGKEMVRVTAGGKVDEFDRVIISTMPKATAKFLQLLPEEKELFNQVVYQQYSSYLYEFSAPRYKPHTAVYMSQSTRSESVGHVVAAISTQKDRNVFGVYQLRSPEFSDAELDRRFNQDVAYLSGNGSKKLIKRVDWDYFPHVGSEALRQGFFDKLAALQGRGGIYYVGGFTNMEFVEYTLAQAKDLVRTRF